MSHELRARCKALAQPHHPCSAADAGAQLSTDGAPDSRSKDDKEFLMDGVYASLSAGPMNAKEMGTRLVDAVRKHATGRKPHDDLTVVTFGRLK